MGCCHAKPTSPAQQKSAFSDFTKKNEHHGGDSNYTLSSVNKGLKNSVKYYSTRVKSSPSQDGNYTIEAVRVDTNSTDHQRLHAAELNTQNKFNNPATLPSAHPKPFEKHTFKATLSPNDASPKPPTKLNNENNINNNTINLANEREVSVSKSRSRQFRPRSEPTDRSPETANGNGSAPPNIKKEISSDPPPINDEDEDDYGSSSSGDEEIPGLKEIVLSDDEEDDDEDEEDDANLQLMQFLVTQENERLALEIKRMKTTVIEQENKKLKQEAFDEIELEAKSNNNTNEDEEDKKTKALLRYEKKRKQRMKEKEQAKERRRLKKVGKKKKLKAKLLKKRMLKRQAERVKKRDELREKRKKELEAYNVEEARPTRQQIIQMFDKYFYKPFDSKRGMHSKGRKKKVTLSESSSDSWTSSEEEEELGEKGINFDGFMAGISVLGIATILSKSEVEQLFDHMTISSREHGINAVDFCHFLKQNTIVLDPKIATIQRKVISMLAKQQDKEEGLAMEEPDNHIDGGTKYDEIEDITTNEVDDLRKLVIQISEPIIYDTPDTPDTPNTPKHSVADIITPETPKNGRENNDFEDEEEHRRERAASISMSESMSVSISVSQSMKIPSNVPRKSFKQINYNWNDSISQKSFNNYKKIREKFGMRYHRHSKNKTKDFELNKAHEKIFSDKLDHLINNDVMLDNDNNDLPPPSQPVPVQEDKPAAADKPAHDNKENKIPDIPSKVLVNNASQSSGSSSAKIKIVLSGIDESKEDGDEHDFDGLSEKRSAVKSLRRITEYKGNEEMNSLRTLYKQQFKMKQKLDRLRKRSLLNFPEPAKPKNVEHLMDDRTKYICQELKQCICKNTRYTGLANFGPNGELGIEIEFTSDCDENGYIVGKRVIHFKGMKQALGTGRIWVDVLWNGHRFVPCTKFEWMDEGDGVTTKFWFDSVKSEIDVDHSFFQGKCIRYPTDLDPNKKTTKLIMHEGYFDFVCVSARRRSLRRNSLLQYHTLDINEMTENELEKVPKYVRRMSAYTEKIDQLYEADVHTTRETLFGDAISTVAAINEVDPVTSDTSLPEQINE